MKLAVVALATGSAAGFSVLAPARPTVVPRAACPAMAGGLAVADSPLTDDIWGLSPAVRVQGQTLKTWDVGDESTERVQLSLKSDGRPIDANVELWHTPSYIPTKFKLYTWDGRLAPVNAVIETPKHPKTVAVYNTGSMEFPFDATVAKTGLGKAADSLAGVPGEMVQGGKVVSHSYGPEVRSVAVLLKTDERNMKAKVEITQGPNQVKQYIELYASVGYKNPFYAVIQLPGHASTVRVVNQNTVEFPFDAWVEPYEVSDDDGMEPVMGSGGWM